MRILRSLEEFLYELVGWLVFYPRTFWRILRHPAAIARYTESELSQPPERQFTETISPVLMMILSVIVAHGVELASRAMLPEAKNPMGRLFFGSEQALLLTRCVAFSTYALVAALVTLRRQRQAVTRQTLRTPFSIQSFLVSPFVLMFACAVLISRTADGWIVGLGVALAIASVLWYIWARAAAYRETTGGGWLHALTVVFGGFLATTVLIFAFLGLALLE
jgi:hypothetical protein